MGTGRCGRSARRGIVSVTGVKAGVLVSCIGVGFLLARGVVLQHLTWKGGLFFSSPSFVGAPLSRIYLWADY